MNEGMLSSDHVLSQTQRRFVQGRVGNIEPRLPLRTKQRTHLSRSDQRFKEGRNDTHGIPFQQRLATVLECVSIQEVASWLLPSSSAFERVAGVAVADEDHHWGHVPEKLDVLSNASGKGPGKRVREDVAGAACRRERGAVELAERLPLGCVCLAASST